MREDLKKAKRLVLKVGTSILTSESDRISKKRLEAVAESVLELLKEKHEVVLVSSGAIAFGMQVAGLRDRPRKMERMQACAAIGQGKLMHAYEQFFAGRRVHTAQLLLTRDGLEMRKRFLAARHTFEELFKMDILPIVNENDTVATEEIAFGDNDILAVQVAHLIHADLLLLLSDVDGFFLKDGSRVRQVTSENEMDQVLVPNLRDRARAQTVGGMKAKLKAARLAMCLGVPLMIVSGHEEDVLKRALAGEDVGTLFVSQPGKRSARQKWIAFSAPRRGTIVVDQGAYEALRTKKRSLLPGGMVRVQGHFARGDVVELENHEGAVFGRGLVRFAHAEVEKIAGKKTREVSGILGYKTPDEVIHRNDMILWD